MSPTAIESWSKDWPTKPGHYFCLGNIRFWGNKTHIVEVVKSVDGQCVGKIGNTSLFECWHPSLLWYPVKFPPLPESSN